MLAIILIVLFLFALDLMTKKLANSSHMFWIIAGLVFVFDQVTKMLITNSLELGQSIKLIPGVLELTYVHNTGASFSLFEGQTIAFIILTVAVLIAIFLLLPKIPKDMRLFRAFIAMFCGGTLGNLIDRAFNDGAVIDFINVPWFSVFNVADCFIVVPAHRLKHLGLFVSERVGAARCWRFHCHKCK